MWLRVNLWPRRSSRLPCSSLRPPRHAGPRRDRRHLHSPRRLFDAGASRRRAALQGGFDVGGQRARALAFVADKPFPNFSTKGGESHHRCVCTPARTKESHRKFMHARLVLDPPFVQVEAPPTRPPRRLVWQVKVEPIDLSRRLKDNSGTLDNILECAAPHRRLLRTCTPALGSFVASTDRSTRCSRAACWPPASALVPAPLSENASRLPCSQTQPPAPVAALVCRVTARSSGLGSPTTAAAAASRQRPRPGLLVPRGPSQVPPARVPVRHGRWATRRQAHGRRALLWRRRRRRRERR